MEIFGHSLSGILLGQALQPKRNDKAWAILAAVSAVFPDIDGVSALWGYDSFKKHHQLYTHNLIAFAIFPVLAAWIGWRVTGRRYPFRQVWVLFQLGMALHLLGDTIAYWPLKIFYPFSHYGLEFQLIDRDFSLGLILVLLVGAMVGWLDKLAPYRRWTAVGTLVAAVLYVLVGPGW